jgi:hypothetical protein
MNRRIQMAKQETMRIVEVSKVDLMDGEEFGELPRKIMQSLTRTKSKLNRSLILTHIFKDHIITLDLETRKKFKMSLERDEKGVIKLGQPEEVKAAFVPVKQTTSKNDDGEEVIETDAPVEVEVTVEPGAPFWGGRFLQ